MNILDAFYILFKTNSAEAIAGNEALEASSVETAASVDKITVAQEAAAVAATEHGAAVAAAGVEAAAGLGLETAAVAEQAAAYVFNRAQRQEFVGLARHSFDQLASGGSIMRVVSSHAATLAEALSNGPGGLSAGLDAAAAAAGRFIKTWGLPLAAIAALVGAVGVAKGSVKDLEETRLMSGRTNIKVDDLDALRKTVRKLGGDTKETDRDLERFANRVDDAFGGKSLESGKQDRIGKTLSHLKVSLADGNGKLKDTKTLLLDVTGALEHLNDKQKSEALRNLGFSSPRHGLTDPAMEKLLLGGRAAFEQRIEDEKRLGGVTEAQVEAAHKYKLATEELGDRFRDVRNIIAQFLLPVLSDLFTALRHGIEWWRLNSTLVTGFGIAFAAMAVVVTAATWGGLIPAFAAAAVAVLAATWPIIAIGAAVAAVAFAFATAYEDVKFFLKGQPSLLGELVNKYEWVRKTVHAVGDAFGWIAKTSKATWRAVIDGATAFGNWIKPFFKGLGEIIGPIARLIVDASVALAKVLGPILGAALKALLGMIVGIVKDLAGGVKGWVDLVGPAFAAAAKFIGPIWDAMFKGWLTDLNLLIYGVRKLFNLKPDAQVSAVAQPVLAGFHAANDHVALAQAHLTTARSTPFAAQTVASVAHAGRGARTFHVKIDKVEVHTQATDANGMAAASADALKSHLRAATSAFDDGVDR